MQDVLERALTQVLVAQTTVEALDVDVLVRRAHMATGADSPPPLSRPYSDTRHSPVTHGVDVKFVEIAVAVRRFSPR